MTAVAAVGLALAAARPARAAELGKDGKLELDADALLAVDFEDATAVAPLFAVLSASLNGQTVVSAPATATEIASVVVGSATAIEGTHELSWRAQDSIGFAIIDAPVFSAVVNQRIAVSFWGRANGMEPYLGVTYGNAVDLPVDRDWAWARIPAIRTGRETSDGWVEYSTGPIDGSVLDRPIHDLTLTARVPTADGTSLLVSGEGLAPHMTDAVEIDAIEIRPVAGPTVASAGACTEATIDSTCGPGGDCALGRCIDAAAVWHPVPPPAMQQEITARVVQWAAHFLGDRTAIGRVSPAWIAATLALARPDATPRSFWNGLTQQVVALRDTHTHIARPYNGIATPFTGRLDANSGPLDVCFGPTLDDLGTGALAYAVWQTGSANVLGLQVGDVISEIDGEDAKTWVDAVYPRYVESLPTDASVDWAPSARDLATLIAGHATTITVQRCTAAGTCATLPPIDVTAPVLAATGSGNYAGYSLTCDDRFTELIPGDRSDSGGGDVVLSAALDATTVGIELDGFAPTNSDTWVSQLAAAYALPHQNVLIDAREGFGGYNALGAYFVQQLRSTAAPAALTLVSRGTFDVSDPASLYAFDWTACTNESMTSSCDVNDIFTYADDDASPTALASRVAYLNTDDFSNNDMVPRQLQGRANLRIFAPFGTYGALGSDIPLPPLMSDWLSGSIAASDGRYGTTPAATETAARFESGHPVEPDQIVTQTLSDVLAGHDTIVTAAKAWLAQGAQ